MDFHLQADTICAIATPVGEGGIGIIRISGPEALAVAQKVFRPRRASSHLESHRLTLGWIVDPASDACLDEVLLCFMAGPRTYTREDVVEINCHSGYAVLSAILELILASGIRLAQPGEFTRRAYLNGRIDLSQAEAVIDVIRSRSRQSLLHAGRQLQGEFRSKVTAWREALLDLQSRLEAAIDFSEDLDGEADFDLTEEFLVRELIEPVSRLLEAARDGQVLREGLTLVLAGKPNVGKSSLLNALLRKDRAIVTPFPGTTRDVIEDSFLLRGVQVRVLDTAGIRRKPDEIESFGIERTLRCIEEADAVLWLVDKSRPLSDEDDVVFRSIAAKRCVLLLNKNDLPPAVHAGDVEARFGTAFPILELSALNAGDVDRLREHLADAFLRRPMEISRSTIVPNLRHGACLERAMESLVRARDLLSSGGYAELLSVECVQARRHLEAILGRERDDELLERIFSQFCIGK